MKLVKRTQWSWSHNYNSLIHSVVFEMKAYCTPAMLLVPPELTEWREQDRHVENQCVEFMK